MEFGRSILNHWDLDKNITFLNNGSFGSTPKIISEAANDWQKRIETEPVNFFMEEYSGILRNTARKLGEFVGTSGDNIVFVDNASTGINTVLKSLLPEIKPNDEILTTNHVYPGVRNTLKYISKISGCRIIEAYTPFPLKDKDELVNSLKKYINKNTYLVLLDHVVFSTGTIFPLKETIEFIKSNNILTFIDGAHAPGMLKLNIDDIGADWYTGNCHKWLYTPKGCAMLWSAPERQSMITPLTTSLFHGEGYTREFDWQGTKNPIPFLSLSNAIDFHNSFGKDKIQDYIYKLAIKSREVIAKELNLEIPCPNDMIGGLVTLELSLSQNHNDLNTIELRSLFYNEYQIEIPFMEFDNKKWFRYSCQIYNDMDDYINLIEAIRNFIK